MFTSLTKLSIVQQFLIIFVAEIESKTRGNSLMLVLVKKNTLESQMNQTYGLKGTMLANNHKMELLKQFITFEINMNIVIMLQWKH